MPLNDTQTFLRWVGGKRRLVRHLRTFVPVDIANRIYREPFLGGGSMFLGLLPTQAVLSDLNEDLIQTFVHLRANHALIAKYLRRHARNHNEEYYYRMRGAYNAAAAFSFAQSARFIYLNRTCFNGIFRVNKDGDFNVPSGQLSQPLFPDASHLEWVAKGLIQAKLIASDYRDALKEARPGDFIYLDPPYPPLNGTSFFRHYTAERFDHHDQSQLSEHVRALTKRGCLVMVSNADTPDIRRLYAGFSVATIPVTRYVSCKNRKHAVQELVITNYGVSRNGS